MMSKTSISGAVWPGSGIWAASYRVMFTLAALWAMVSVGLWTWGAGLLGRAPMPHAWHVHEMLFGLGGAALAGYLPTACAGWTGRAPVSGWPVRVLAALWVLARGVALLPDMAPPVVVAVGAAAMFWWLAGLLAYEAWKGAPVARPGFILFCAVVGAAAAVSILAIRSGESSPARILGGVVLFACLLLVVGGRMAPAFLNREAQRHGALPGRDRAWTATVGIGLLVLSGLCRLGGALPPAGMLLIAAAAVNALRMAAWPLPMVRHNALLCMIVLGFAWLPVGLLLWGLALIGHGPVAESEALHGLMMGGMGGLIVAVAARASARRSVNGLIARRPAILAFLLVWVSVWVRMGGSLEPAAGLWIAGWALFLLGHVRSLRGPVPRPVFSGARSG